MGLSDATRLQNSYAKIHITYYYFTRRRTLYSWGDFTAQGEMYVITQGLPKD